MQILSDYQLFLFDFDGLLVNTEHLHFQAYKNMCERRGFHLDWSFLEFCAVAHRASSKALCESIYQKFPDLEEQEPEWEILYREKQREYLELLQSGKVELMPGVALFLDRLFQLKKGCCVVTNATKMQVELIQAAQPLLRSIPHWITRESYLKPKPDGECYQRAIQLYGQPGDKIIGFEDTIKGLSALLQTPATAVLICEKEHPQLSVNLEKGVLYYTSFKEILESDADR